MPLHSIHRANSGLNAAMRNLAVTGHNMANVSTDGFSRQRVNQVDFASQTRWPAAGANISGTGRGGVNPMQVGLGTDISSVLRLRNTFLDNHYRAEIGAAHFYDTKRRASHDIEISMGELTNRGSGVAVTRQLWASLQELSLDPGAIDTRGNFLSGLNSFLNRMNDTHRRLMEQQQVMNGQVKDLVDESNQLLHTINQLNQAIRHAELSGQNANDFRDSRDLASDRLSAILDVDLRINQGNGNLEIITNGHALLAGDQVRHIGLRFTETGGNLVEPVIGDQVRPGGPILGFDPTFRNAFSILRLDTAPRAWDRPGELMGVIMSRGLSQFTNHASQHERFPRYNEDGVPFAGHPGQNINDFMFVRDPNRGGNISHIPLSQVEMDRAQAQWEGRRQFNTDHSVLTRTLRHLDQMFNHTVSMINEFLTNQNASSIDPAQWGTRYSTNSTGNPTLDLHGNPGIPIFVQNNDGRADIDARRFPIQQWAVTAAILNPNADPALHEAWMNDPANAANIAADGPWASPYHAWIDNPAAGPNNTITHIPNPPSGQPGHLAGIAVGQDIPNPLPSQPGHVAGMYLPGPVNHNTLNYTLGNVSLNPLLLTPEGYNFIGLQRNAADTSDPHILLNLLSTWHAQLLSLDGQAPKGIDDFYNQMVLELSTQTERLANLAETSSFAIAEIEGQRARSFGVSLDEEMTHMIRFQHSFNSAARVVNVLSEMIDLMISTR